MLFDALVLAGGRSSRLSGTAKARLRYRGESLLSRTVKAAVASGARTVVVVGEAEPEILGAHVIVMREDPPYGGPAAGIAAGMTALAHSVSLATDAFTLVLACDMPQVADAVPPLVAELIEPVDADGVIAVDGRHQPLVAIYKSDRLLHAIAVLQSRDAIEGTSVRALIAGLRLIPVQVPPGSTDDIDTWADARRYGVEGADARVNESHNIDDTELEQGSSEKGHGVSDESTEERLKEWAETLVSELGIAELEVNVASILALAGNAAHAVVRPAAPVTTFIAGYAAGHAAASGIVSSAAAVEAALAAANRLAGQHADERGDKGEAT
jgi:molybdopterin-guanine dinucleotide biosynthesis protein A